MSFHCLSSERELAGGSWGRIYFHFITPIVETRTPRTQYQVIFEHIELMQYREKVVLVTDNDGYFALALHKGLYFKTVWLRYILNFVRVFFTLLSNFQHLGFFLSCFCPEICLAFKCKYRHQSSQEGIRWKKTNKKKSPVMARQEMTRLLRNRSE